MVGPEWPGMGLNGNFLNRGFVILLTLELGAVDSVNRLIKFRDLLPFVNQQKFVSIRNIWIIFCLWLCYATRE